MIIFGTAVALVICHPAHSGVFDMEAKRDTTSLSPEAAGCF